MQGKDSCSGIGTGEGEATVVETHYLSGKGETYAGSLLFGGIERYKDFLSTLLADWGTVIAYFNYHIFKGIKIHGDLNSSGTRLCGIFHKVYENLGNLVLVCPQQNIRGFLHKRCLHSSFHCIRGCKLHYPVNQLAHQE